MVFDITNQALKCSYCGTRLSIEEYKGSNEAEKQPVTYDSVVYTCRNCGAELTAPDEQTVAYCSYCGGEQMLMAKHEQLLRPKRIIPFKKSKKQAKNEYQKALKGKLYVPKEFKDPNFLEGFRGIYLPYFSYNAVVPKNEIMLKGEAHYTKGNYDYDEEYDVYASVGGRTQEINFDASSAFDDTLANEIAPFMASDLTEFHEGYLAGLYADKATANGSIYVKAAQELAVDSIYKEIEKEVPKVSLTRSKNAEEDRRRVGLGAVDCEVSYFPVWFLTWKNKNRVAYSVMNGQTGKLTTDIPVNKGMFFLVSLIAAAILFGILSVLPMFILPKMICAIAAVLLLVSGILLHREVKKIYERESHVYDYGDTLHTAEKKKMTPRQAAEAEKTQASGAKKKKSKTGWIGWVIPFAYIIFLFLFYSARGAGALLEMLSTSYTVVFFIVLPIQLVFSIFTIINAARIERKMAIAPAIIAPIVLIAGIVIGLINSPYDYWYYGTALACLAAMVLNGLSAINYFNYLTTRPVPNFFRREGANNEK